MVIGQRNQNVNFMTKTAFNRKKSLMISKLNTEPRKKLVLYLEYCIAWLKDLDYKRTGAKVIGELRNVMMDGNCED